MEGQDKKEEIEPNVLQRLFSFVSLNKVLTVMMILTLLCCAITLYVSTNYQEACNRHWIGELERIGCVKTSEPVGFNQTFVNNIMQNING